MPMLAAATSGGYQERLTSISNPLVLYDWGDTNCYSGSGTTFSNLGSGGSTYDGDLIGGVSYSSDFGGIMTTDGSNDHIQVDNGITLLRAGGTMMVWIRTHQDESRPFGTDSDNRVDRFCNFGGTDGVDRAETNQNCNDWYSANGANAKGSYTNQWYCALARCTGNTVTWIEMGQQQSGGSYNRDGCSGPVTNIMHNNVTMRRFGERTSYDSHFDGDYGVMAWWNSALSFHECQEAFGAYRHRYGV